MPLELPTDVAQLRRIAQVTDEFELNHGLFNDLVEIIREERRAIPECLHERIPLRADQMEKIEWAAERADRPTNLPEIEPYLRDYQAEDTGDGYHAYDLAASLVQAVRDLHALATAKLSGLSAA